MPVVHAMTTVGNAGDSNAVLAIATKINNGSVIVLADNQPEVITKLEQSLQPDAEHVLLISGVHGLKFLGQALRSEKVKTLIDQKKIVISWCGHQAPPDFNEYADQLHVVGLLQEAIEFDPNLKSTLGRRLVSMEFVPNTLTKEILESGTALEEWNKNHPTLENIPDSKNGYIAAFLPGDAPDRAGVYKFYSAEDAYKLGMCLAKEAISENKFLLVTNGPRMGKFDPASPDPKNPIIIGKHIKGEPMDHVTTAFLNGVLDSGIAFDKFLLLDYVDKDSAYAAIACAVYRQDKNSAVYTFGDSISNQELGYFFTNVTAIKVNVMSDLHTAFLERISKNLFRVAVAQQEGEQIKCESVPDPGLKQMYLERNPDNDAQNIAGAIEQELQLLKQVRIVKAGRKMFFDTYSLDHTRKGVSFKLPDDPPAAAATNNTESAAASSSRYTAQATV